MFNEHFSFLDSMMLVGLKRDMGGREFYGSEVDYDVFPDDWFDRMCDLGCIVDVLDADELWTAEYIVEAYWLPVPPECRPSGTAFEILVRA